MGGLGNQMFQYAAGLSALKEYSQFTNFKLDTSFYNGQERKVIVNGLTGRGYDLDLFNIKYDEIEESPEGELMLQGYFQNVSEFENVIDEVKDQFTFKNSFPENIQNLSSQIEKIESSVCLHVRRSDYVNNPKANAVHGVIGIEYYNTAMELIQLKYKNPVYYVFSDDIEWCKDNLKSDYEMHFVGDDYSGDRDSGHLFLMQMCKNHIIANSSFSWWAAFLSESNCTIAPKKWRTDNTGCDIILDNWIKL
jgi:hypothetical protein